MTRARPRLKPIARPDSIKVEDVELWLTGARLTADPAFVAEFRDAVELTRQIADPCDDANRIAAAIVSDRDFPVIRKAAKALLGDLRGLLRRYDAGGELARDAPVANLVAALDTFTKQASPPDEGRPPADWVESARKWMAMLDAAYPGARRAVLGHVLHYAVKAAFPGSEATSSVILRAVKPADGQGPRAT